jgi:RNA polymerase sigma-70 factor (ECF subfamily)
MSINENIAECPPFPLELGASEARHATVIESEGREEEFNRLYLKYAPLVHGVLLARLPREEVQDVMQEVFIAAFRNLGVFREKKAIGAWLVKVARNQAANFYRASRRTDELDESIEAREGNRSEAAEILQMIRSLPEAYRETLILRLVEGMTGDEIAKMTGLKPESVRVNLHRGMKMLRLRLGIEGGK